jgi:hypothetical protein
VKRDPYLDLLRAGSLAVVVLWHWFGTSLTWSSDGPHASNLLATTPGLWLGTWVLQVMPVFFYVGGYLHRRGYKKNYVPRRALGLLRATTPLLAGWAAVGALLAVVGGGGWAVGTVKFALSPLWFLGVYLLLVLLLPAARWLHRRLGLLALPILAGLAAAVDVLRLGYHVPWVGWLNLVFVWGLAHQAGFHHDRLLRAPRAVGYGLVALGVAGLVGLLTLGYPGSMVGVPGERWSNMSPPTLAIVALTVLQVGLVRLGHPAVPRFLARHTAVLDVANRYGMPVFLFHLTAFLLAQAVGWPLALTALVGLIATTTRNGRVRPRPHPPAPEGAGLPQPVDPRDRREDRQVLGTRLVSTRLGGRAGVRGVRRVGRGGAVVRTRVRAGQ